MSYLDIFSQIGAHLEPCAIPAYSEPCHINNPFHINNVWNPRYIPNSVKAYSGMFRPLCNACMLRTRTYSEFCPIQNFGIFRSVLNIQNPVYLGISRHTQPYSVMIVTITLTLSFTFK